MATTTLADDMFQMSRAEFLLGSLKAIAAAPNEGTVNAQYGYLKPKFQGAPGASTIYYVLLNFMKHVADTEDGAWDWFVGNVGAIEGAIGESGRWRVIGYAERVRQKPQVRIGRISAGASATILTDKKKTITKKKETPKKQVDTAKLDAVIGIVDTLAKLGVAKSKLEAVKNTLELARANAKKTNEPVQIAKYAGELGGAIFEVIADIVKAQDTDLGAQAAKTLGKAAKIFGAVGKGFGAIDDFCKLFNGTTAAGTKVDNNQRAEAAIELIALCLGSTVGGALQVSIKAYEGLFNFIGVPILMATRAIDMRERFGGKDPRALKAKIEAMRVDDPRTVMWAIRTIAYETFKPPMTIQDAWIAYRKAEVESDTQLMNDVTSEQTKPANNDGTMRDERRIQLARSYQRAAIAFIDQQVRQVEGK